VAHREKSGNFCQTAYSQPGGFEGLSSFEEHLAPGDLAISDPVDRPEAKLCIDAAALAVGGEKPPKENQTIRSFGDLLDPTMEALPGFQDDLLEPLSDSALPR
jgi:hypothetical protein